MWTPRELLRNSNKVYQTWHLVEADWVAKSILKNYFFFSSKRCWLNLSVDHGFQPYLSIILPIRMILETRGMHEVLATFKCPSHFEAHAFALIIHAFRFCRRSIEFARVFLVKKAPHPLQFFGWKTYLNFLGFWKQKLILKNMDTLFKCTIDRSPTSLCNLLFKF